MTDYAFLLDISRCIGCQACVAACKTGNEVFEGAHTIRIIEKTRGTFPDLRGWFVNQRCFHCIDAPCVHACPVGAMYKEDGLTRLNRHTCIGCGECVAACPYDIPQVVKGRSFKCDGCNSLVKAGGTPWCVTSCPSHALAYGEREAIIAEAHQRVETLLGRYPRAQVYGDAPDNELGVILVLHDDPDILGMPTYSARRVAVHTEGNAVRPQSMGLSGFSVAIAAISAIIGRRNLLGKNKQDQSGAA